MALPIDQLTISKYLLSKAEKLADELHPLSAGLAISLMQDVVESILWCVAKHVDATVNDNTSFSKFWSLVKDAHKNPNKLQLPLSAKMTELNKARVGFKHYGILPATSEATKFLPYVTEFAQVAVERFFDLDYSQLSLVELIQSPDVRDKLKEAQKHLSAGEFEQCVILCAKAEYVALSRLHVGLPSMPRYFTSYASLFGGDGGYQLQQTLEQLSSSLNSLRTACIVNFLGLNLVEHARFRKIAPAIYMTMNEELHCGDIFRKASHDDAEFSIDYVVRSVISAQQAGIV